MLFARTWAREVHVPERGFGGVRARVGRRKRAQTRGDPGDAVRDETLTL